MEATKENIQAVRNIIENTKTRSAWSKGVKQYAFDLLDSFIEWSQYDVYIEINERTALNGAQNWIAWAWGGSGLVYHTDIAKRLCTASEREKWYKRGCPNRANPREKWLDVEARAVRQAWRMIEEAVRKLEA